MEFECKYCGATFGPDIKHGCLLSDMRPDLRAEVDRAIAEAEQRAREQTLNYVYDKLEQQFPLSVGRWNRAKGLQDDIAALTGSHDKPKIEPQTS